MENFIIYTYMYVLYIEIGANVENILNFEVLNKEWGCLFQIQDNNNLCLSFLSHQKTLF